MPTAVQTMRVKLKKRKILNAKLQLNSLWMRGKNFSLIVSRPHYVKALPLVLLGFTSITSATVAMRRDRITSGIRNWIILLVPAAGDDAG